MYIAAGSSLMLVHSVAHLIDPVVGVSRDSLHSKLEWLRLCKIHS